MGIVQHVDVFVADVVVVDVVLVADREVAILCGIVPLLDASFVCLMRLLLLFPSLLSLGLDLGQLFTQPLRSPVVGGQNLVTVTISREAS